MTKTNISIITPIYNEEKNVQTLYKELKQTLDKLKRSYEIVFIDDASSDRSQQILSSIALKDRKVKAIFFPRNFGQTAALSAGFDYSSGDIIIPMDGDLQNDPKDIPKLLKKIDEGYSVVSGWRKNRKDAFIRVLPSKIANYIIKKFTGVNVKDNGCSLKAYRRDVIENISLYGEMHRFISVYAAWSGGKITEVVVNHRERKHGRSKYGFSRIFKVVLDLMVIKFLYRYISRPIHFFGKYGFWSLAFGLAVAVAAIVAKYGYGRNFTQTPLPQISVLFILAGIQLILSGIIAELLMRTYYESQNKKSYKIKEIMNGK